MQIFAVILNYKSFQDTIALVNNLKLQQQIDLKIIIVDNHSPNESYNKLQEKFENDPDVTVLDSGHNGGYSYGNNFGLKYIEQFLPKYAVVLNNDIKISNKVLLYSLAKEFDNYSNLCVASPQMRNNGTNSVTAWKIPSVWTSIITAGRIGEKKLKPSLIYYPQPDDERDEFVDCLNGSFLFFDYNKFQNLGFFDEGVFLFYEETILGYKIKIAGGSSILFRKYSYEHFGAKTINSIISYIDKLKLLQKSLLYFHTNYSSASKFKIALLKIMFMWRISEEILIFKFRKLIGKV